MLSKCSPFVLVDFFLIHQLSVLSRKLIQLETDWDPPIAFESQFVYLENQKSYSSALMVAALENYTSSILID